MVLFHFPTCVGSPTAINKGFKALGLDHPFFPSISTQDQGSGKHLVGCKSSTSIAPKRRKSRSISTKKPKGKIEIVSRKSPITVLSNQKLRQSISTKSHHPTSIKKAKGKMKLLEFLSRGLDLPTAVAVICIWAGYKSRSTVYKWIEEDPEFTEQVLTVEMAVLGFLQMREFELAKGGQVLKDVKKTEFYSDGNVIRKKTHLEKRWKPPNAQACFRAIDRIRARLKRIEQAQGKAKALMEID